MVLTGCLVVPQAVAAIAVVVVVAPTRTLAARAVTDIITKRVIPLIAVAVVVTVATTSLAEALHCSHEIVHCGLAGVLLCRTKSVEHLRLESHELTVLLCRGAGIGICGRRLGRL